MFQRPFQPPIRKLMGPNPADVQPRILAAIACPTIGHLDAAVIGMLDAVKDLLRGAFGTEST
jgi:alanine-glyoxylate transaminase/serine-glyoxylate transaminase/serine-pyruvate transaminase